MVKELVGPGQQPYYSVGDDIVVWIGGGGSSVHIKTNESHGDPVELAEDEVVELIELLSILVAKMRQPL